METILVKLPPKPAPNDGLRKGEEFGLLDPLEV
jgi:hypothetical protein